MKSKPLQELYPFQDLSVLLASFVTKSLDDATYKTARISQLAGLHHQDLLESAKKSLEVAFLVLQKRSFFSKFTANEIMSVFHAHKVLMQELVKTDKVSKILDREHLVKIVAPDLHSARYLDSYMSDSDTSYFLEKDERIKYSFYLAQFHREVAYAVVNRETEINAYEGLKDTGFLTRQQTQFRIYLQKESPQLLKQEITLKSRTTFLRFCKSFAQYLKKIETSAMLRTFLEEHRSRSISHLKNIRSSIFELSDEELERLNDNSFRSYKANLFYTRNICKNSANALIPHVIDYCHRTSPKKKRFVFSERSVKIITKRVLSNTIKNKPGYLVIKIVRALLSNKRVSRLLLPRAEFDDLAWYANKLQDSVRPQQRSLHRYFKKGDASNFKKVMSQSKDNSTPLKHGPLLKNKYTQQLEYIVNTHQGDVKLHKHGDKVLIDIKGVTFDLNKIIAFANFNHIKMEAGAPLTDGTRDGYELSDFKIQSINDTWEQVSKKGFDSLSMYIEGDSDYNNIIRKGPQQLHENSVLRVLVDVCHSSFLLNQFKEKNMNPVFRNVGGKGRKITETHPEMLALRGGFSKEAFLSTSLSWPNSPSVKDPRHFVYTETRAPYVGRFNSQFENEYESLIPPSHMQWVQMDEDDVGRKYFIIKQVAALDALVPEEHETLLDEDSVTKADEQGNTPLHFAALYDHSILARLLQSGVNINRRNCNGVTAFHIIAQTAREEIIRLCLDCGGDITIKNAQGKTPFDFLFMRNLSQELRDSLQKKLYGEFNLEKEVLISLPLNWDKIENEESNVNQMETPAHGCKDDGLLSLLQGGVSINRPDCNGVTAFHLVAQTGTEETIRAFLDYGANLLVPDAQGQTPYSILFRRNLSKELRDAIKYHYLLLDCDYIQICYSSVANALVIDKFPAYLSS